MTRSFNDARKAAVLLLSLDRAAAQKVLALLPKRAVEAVSAEIVRVDDVTAEQQAAVLTEFETRHAARVKVERGGLKGAEELLAGSLGEEAAREVVENLRQNLDSVPFSFLQKAGADNLLTFVSEEHPQTIALILSHLPAGLAAEVISGLTPDKQIDVIRRVAGMEQTSPDVVEEVEASLRRRMTSTFDQTLEKAGGAPRVAEILNVTDRMTNKGILESLDRDDADLADQIRRLMFVFDDLLKLDNKAIQALLKEVDTSRWALALKGAGQELTDKVLGNLSQRAADMLREEMDYLGPVKLSEVEAAQGAVVDTVRRLEDSGEITVGSGAQAEQYVT
ncbi:flagellar motor switch protein FliG [Alienimonas californiensis]|uniref:Flagellar motor switch protein FliG n=1 Tax=Alienimonas californiensis TaxID=2527989 RepID=A0A517PE65_9PLAN|nr:flagellar motor switch protein FliG [Alienimonas californiensis]QDT17641.1 Flagellar motor switch protein FliG [Alienimonas californiensis]